MAELQLKTPNFNDPRVKRKMQSAYGWVMATMSVDQEIPKELYCIDIKEHLGQAQTPLAKWLKYKLLTCVDETYSKDRGKCKKYILNLSGTRDVAEILNYNAFTGLFDKESSLNSRLGVEWTLKTYDFDKIEYREKSSRYWNPIQNLRKEIRNEYLAHHGLTEQYDVECCAQTLMYQTYLQYTDKRLMMMEAYLEDRTSIRNKVAQDVGLSVNAVKQILTALNNNSRLQADARCSIFHLTGYSERKVIAFNNHPSIVYLKADMKGMWRVLGKHIDREYITTVEGKTRKKILNGSIKSSLYFALEKQVMDVAYNYLETNNKRFFKLHDAFISEPLTRNQVEEITQLVKTNTNYNIKLEKTNTDI